MSRRTHDVLIVGAGIVGASIAYHLSLRKIDVGVIERAHLAAGASGANAAIVGAAMASPVEYALFEEAGKKLLARLADETRNTIRYQPRGRLSLLQDAEALRRAEEIARRNRDAGIPVEILPPEDARRLEPEIDSTRIVGAAFCPTDGQLDPFATLSTLVAKAGTGGSTFYFHTLAEHIDCDRRSVAVVTPDGIYRASTLVVAAGVHTPALVHPLGVEIPVRPVRGQILVTEALPRLFQHVVSPGITQCPEGNVLLGVSTEEAGFDQRTTLPVLSTIAGEAIAKAPVLRTARLLRTFAGLRPMPRDGLPILDVIHGRENVFVAVAHNAVTSSQAIGQGMAEWIVEDHRPVALVPFGLARSSLAEECPISKPE